MVILRKGRGIWKVRIIPSLARLLAVVPVTSLPAKFTFPCSLNNAPEMQLIKVVLPDPFGPINPSLSLSPRETLTPSSATKPPNRFVRFVTERIGSVISLSPLTHEILIQTCNPLWRQGNKTDQYNTYDQ